MVMQRTSRNQRALAADGAHRTAGEARGKNLQPLVRLAVNTQQTRAYRSRGFAGDEFAEHRRRPTFARKLRDDDSIAFAACKAAQQRIMIPADALPHSGRRSA